MIKIIIENDNVEISTENETSNGCTEQERKLLLSVAEALSKEYHHKTYDTLEGRILQSMEEEME